MGSRQKGTPVIFRSLGRFAALSAGPITVIDSWWKTPVKAIPQLAYLGRGRIPNHKQCGLRRNCSLRVWKLDVFFSSHFQGPLDVRLTLRTSVC